MLNKKKTKKKSKVAKEERGTKSASAGFRGYIIIVFYAYNFNPVI